MACMDTTLLIDLLNRKSQRHERAIDKVTELLNREHALVTTRFNVAELYVGIARSLHPKREEKAIWTLLEYIEILEFTDKAAAVFGAVNGHLQCLGRPAGDMDVLIAATAMVHGHSLITRNPKHFRLIPELVVEDY